MPLQHIPWPCKYVYIYIYGTRGITTGTQVPSVPPGASPSHPRDSVTICDYDIRMPAFIGRWSVNRAQCILSPPTQILSSPFPDRFLLDTSIPYSMHHRASSCSQSDNHAITIIVFHEKKSFLLLLQILQCNPLNFEFYLRNYKNESSYCIIRKE